jgi:putative membrane protein
MNPPVNYNWHIPQRQARAGLLILGYKAIITLIKTLWPLLVIMLVRQGSKTDGRSSFVWIFLVIAALVLVRSVLDYFYFRFYIEQDELIIKKGFISRKVITIPLPKIQAVHIEQTWLHQLTDIVKMKIDTAGSEKAEAVIDAITVDKADQLKSFLLDARQPATGDTPVQTVNAPQLRETPIIRLSLGDLLKLGLSANHIQAFFIVLAFAFSMVQNLEEIFGDRVITLVKDSSTSIGITLQSISLLVLFVLLISVVVSIGRILLNYFDFRLAETDQGFRLRAGLINTRQYVVPFSKIQFISWEANWVRRMIGLYTLEFHQVAGDDVKEKRRVKTPVTRAADIEKILHHYHEPIHALAHSVHQVHQVYPYRRMLLAGIIPVIVLLLVGWLTKWNDWMWLFLLWVPYVFVNAWVFRSKFRLFVAPDAFQVNSGIWGRTVRIVQWYKIQNITLKQSIYQRMKGLASLQLNTAGGKIIIPYISLELAHMIQNYALYEVERTPKSWM